MKKTTEYIEDFIHIVKVCEGSKLESFFYKNGHISIQFSKCPDGTKVFPCKVHGEDTQDKDIFMTELNVSYDLDNYEESFAELAGTSANTIANEVIVSSPYVGTVEFSKKLKLATGEVHVDKGESICSIEAMKIYNDITSPVTGTIVEILIEDCSLAEFEQPIVKIRVENHE